MASMAIRVLMVDCDDTDSETTTASRVAPPNACLRICKVATLDEVTECLASQPFDVVVIDAPGHRAPDMVREVGRIAPCLPIVVYSASYNERVAMAAIDAGAQECVAKDSTMPDCLESAIRFALVRQRYRNELVQQVRQLELHNQDLINRHETAQRDMESQLRLSQAQKMGCIGELAAGIAHEINTPTQYVGDNLQFLRDAFDGLVPILPLCLQLVVMERAGVHTPELWADFERAVERADIDFSMREVPSAIEQSLDGISRVATIVRAMKDFSHPDCDEKVPLDLNRAIESTLTIARCEWKYVAEVVTRLDDTLPPVMCLPGELNQVVLNLLINATHAIADARATRDEHFGRIDVESRRVGDYAEIRISDNGTGIPEAIRGRIFDPFFTTKEVGRGTGQGLAISHSVIVEKHGGTIDIESVEGEGSTFIVRLPLVPGTCMVGVDAPLEECRP